MSRSIDLSAAASFLSALVDTKTERIIIQTFPDLDAKTLPPGTPKPPDNPLLARVFNTSLVELSGLEPALQALQDQGAGVFFQVNAGERRGKKHVSRIRALFVDADGAPMEPVKAAMPVPAAVVFSSPGKFHVYWSVVDCALPSFTPAQKALAAAYGTDPTVHNLDRVMRLPGTWHLKNPAAPYKVAASLPRGGNPKTYTLNELSPGGVTSGVPPQSQQQPARNHAGTHPVPATARSGSGRLLDSLQAGGEAFVLPAILPPGDRTQTLVRYAGSLVGQGYNEASVREAVKKACVERCPPGAEPIPDDVMEREIMGAVASFIQRRDLESAAAAPLPTEHNPFGPDAQPQPMDHVNGHTLEAFLDRYVFVETDSLVIDTQAHSEKAVYKFREFERSHENKRVGTAKLAGKWLRCPARKTVRDTIYVPSAEKIITQQGHEMYNTFGGYAAQPLQCTWDDPDLDIMKRHLYLLMPEAGARLRLLKWMAFGVQRPDIRIPWAPLIISQQGVGKGWLYHLLMSMVGAKNCAMINPDDLGEKKSQYNEYMSGTLIVCLDEMRTQRRWDMMERLKPLITEPHMMVNRKFGGKGQERIFANFIVFTNHPDAAALTADDRRFWVYHSQACVPSNEYFNELYGWLKTCGPAKLLYLLMNQDLSDYKFAERPPMTKAKERMIEESMGEIEQCIRDAIEDKTGIFEADIVDHSLVERFVMSKLNISQLDSKDKNIIRHVLASLSPELLQSRYRIDLKRDGSENVKVRCKCIRNAGKWQQETAENIGAEYHKAWLIATSLIRT